MHEYQEYRALCDETLARAKTLADTLAQAGRPKGVTIHNFLRDFAYLATPGPDASKFTAQEWIAASSNKPLTDTDSGITLLLYFSDDTLPVVVAPNLPRFGGSSRHKPRIELYNVDHLSVTERAVTLLHEAHHCLNRFGQKLAGIPPLNRPDTEEINSWIFTYSLLEADESSAWHQAVMQEIQWLNQKQPPIPAPGQFTYECSGIYWPELDHCFAPTSHDHVKKLRMSLVAIRANCAYWPARTYLSPEDVCLSLVKEIYTAP